jgi:hypothetical protein
VDQLRAEHSIYLTGDGRISMAGITEHNVDYIAQACMHACMHTRTLHAHTACTLRMRRVPTAHERCIPYSLLRPSTPSRASRRRAWAMRAAVATASRLLGCQRLGRLPAHK